MSGAGAAGTVEFFNGTTSLGAATAISGGVASKVLSGIAVGSYAYTAKFVPTNAAAFTPSTSLVSTYVVTGAPVPGPTASFTASAISGLAPLAVTFADTSTGGPTSWLWTFGNGSTSNVQNPPAVTYTEAGTYTVTLIVSNANGASAPVSTTITVTAPPVESAAVITSLSPRHGVVGSIVTIQGSGFGALGTMQFGAVAVTATSWTDTQIVFEVPAGAYARSALVSVTPEGGAASNAVKFRFDRVRTATHPRGNDGRQHVHPGGDSD